MDTNIKGLSTKTKGCKKCGRSAKKANAVGGPTSLFVRDKISAKEYFLLIGLSLKG